MTILHFRGLMYVAFGVWRAAGFKNETDVENFFSGETSRVALGAVVFDAESFDGDEVRRDAPVTYKIRLRAEQYMATYFPLRASSGLGGSAGKWLTSHMFPRRTTIGPRGDMYGGEEPGWNQH